MIEFPYGIANFLSIRRDRMVLSARCSTPTPRRSQTSRPQGHVGSNGICGYGSGWAVAPGWDSRGHAEWRNSAPGAVGGDGDKPADLKIGSGRRVLRD